MAYVAPRSYSPLDRLEFRIERIPESGCWIWLGHLCWGYGQIMIDHRRYRAHRFAWEIFNGPVPDNMIVCHRCDVACCVNPAHLFLGTTRDNVDDKVAKGRQNRGESHGCATLTEGQVLEIVRATESAPVVAKRFNISPDTIRRIRRGEHWSHVTGIRSTS